MPEIPSGPAGPSCGPPERAFADLALPRRRRCTTLLFRAPSQAGWQSTLRSAGPFRLFGAGTGLGPNWCPRAPDDAGNMRGALIACIWRHRAVARARLAHTMMRLHGIAESDGRSRRTGLRCRSHGTAHGSGGGPNRSAVTSALPTVSRGCLPRHAEFPIRFHATARLSDNKQVGASSQCLVNLNHPVHLKEIFSDPCQS